MRFRGTLQSQARGLFFSARRKLWPFKIAAIALTIFPQ